MPVKFVTVAILIKRLFACGLVVVVVMFASLMNGVDNANYDGLKKTLKEH